MKSVILVCQYLFREDCKLWVDAEVLTWAILPLALRKANHSVLQVDAYSVLEKTRVKLVLSHQHLPLLFQDSVQSLERVCLWVLSSKHPPVSPPSSLVLTTGPSISLGLCRCQRAWRDDLMGLLQTICSYLFVQVWHLLLSCWPSWRALSWLCLRKGTPLFCILREDITEASSLFLPLLTKEKGELGHKEPRAGFKSCSFITVRMK